MIRIVDPLGLQVVWVSPTLAGGIVGYYTRTSSKDAWTEVLACSAEKKRAGGSELLLRDRLTEQMVPAQGSDSTWTFASRDPTETTISGRIHNQTITVSLQCDEGELQILFEQVDASPGYFDAGLRLHVGAEASLLKPYTLADGVLQFEGGSLSSIFYRHSPELICQVRDGNCPGDQQIDFIPRSRGCAGKAASPIVITLYPTPASHPSTT